MQRVGIVGGGLMGSGIAQVAAQAGFDVTLREVSAALCERARSSIARTLEKGIEKGKVTAEARDAALAHLSVTTELDALAPCELVVEAIVEQLAPKLELWRALHAICGAETIFATNTSSLSVAAMAAGSGRPDRMVGLHFFNPVPLMKLVEVVRTVTTSEATFARAMEFARRVGKEPVAARDNSGFVVNRLLIPYLLDAITALEHGVGSVEDIDKGMQLGTGHPMGPFTLLDFVGLDTILHAAEAMFDEYRERRFAPPPLLRRMVVAGMLGRKSGKGFYDYAGETPVVSALGI